MTKGNGVLETIEALRVKGKTMLGIVSIIDIGK